MPAATSKSDLIEVTEAEWHKLTETLGAVTPSKARLADTEGWTIKDVIAHRAHWIDLFLGWYRDGQAGRDVSIPAPGYKWNQLKEYNADLRHRQRTLTWPEAQRMLVDRKVKLLSLIVSLDEDALYGDPMPGGNGKWTTGRWAEAVGPSHFRSANKYIRTRLRKG